MVDARQQLDQARQQIEEQRRVAEERERQLSESRARIEQQRKELGSQRILRQTNRSGQVKRGVALRKLGEAEGQIQKGIGEIQKFKQEVSRVEQDINLGQKKVEAYETLERQIRESAEQEPGFISSKRLNLSKQAFEQAGLDPLEAERIYTEALTPSGSASIWSQGTMSTASGTDKEFLGTISTKTGKLELGKDVIGGMTFSSGEYSAFLDPTKRDSLIKVDVPSISLPSISEQSMSPAKDGVRYKSIDAQRFDPLSDAKRIKELTKEVGYFKAIPTFVGEQFRVGVTKAQVALGKPFGEPEPLALPSGKKIETPATRISSLGGFTAEAGLYSTAPGSVLLIGGGVESYATPSGRERLKLTGRAISEKTGLPSKSAYLIPAAEIGLGLLGVRGTRADPFRPVVKKEQIAVDVKYAKGYTRTEGAAERIITRDSSGNVVNIERGIPTVFIKDVGVPGVKSSVTTPFREFFGMKPLYSGLPIERRAVTIPGIFGRDLIIASKYERAYNLLKSRGLSDYQARQALRQVRPQYQRTIGKGDMTIVGKGESTPIGFFKGKQTTSYVKGERGGVKFLMKQPKLRDVDEGTQYLGQRLFKTKQVTGITKKGKLKGKIEEGTFDLVGFERIEVKPTLSDERLIPKELRTGAGKTTETFKGVVGAKYLKEVRPSALDFLSKREDVLLRMTPESTYARYKTADISKKIIPRERRLLSGEGIADVSRAEPKFTITDDTIIRTKGIMGGGSKSSPQYLENLYKTEKVKAETALGLLKKKVPKQSPSPSKVISGKTSPSANVGIGLYSAGVSQVYGESNILPGVSTRSSSREFTRDIASDLRSGFSSGITGKAVAKTQVTAQTEFTSDRTEATQRQFSGTATQVGFSITGRQTAKLGQPQIEIQRATQPTKTTPLERTGIVQEIIKPATTSQKSSTRPKEPKKTRETIKTSASKPSLVKRMIKKAETQPDIFKVFVRKDKRDIQTGAFRSKEEAKKSLLGKISQELRASGFIENAGRKISFKELNIISPSFTAGKSESFRVVEKREKRLKRGTREVPEIQAFKKIKRNKKNVFGI